MATPLSREHRIWRTKVFLATWLSYVGLYFCRKNWSVAKAAIQHQNDWGVTTVGNIYAAYLIGYAVGQFLASRIANLFGPRQILLVGMGVSIALNVAMGLGPGPSLFGGLMAVNGVAQATGWSANVGTMANWFHKHERGKVMGAWSTNFTVGSLLTAFVFGLVLGDVDPNHQPWQQTFFLGAMVLGAVSVQFFFFQRTRPEDVMLAPIDDPLTAVDESQEPAPAATKFTRDQWTNILIVGGFYFFAKLIRYAVWSWGAYFLTEKFHKSGSASSFYSMAFEVCGIPGVLLTGWLSDRFFKSRRAGVALIMTLGMCVATALFIAFGDQNAMVFTILLGAVGFFLFGPDALLSGAGAMDIGNRRVAMRATAIICTFGALGPVVQEVIIPRVYDQKTAGLGPVFAILFISAAGAAFFCALLVLRNRRGGKGI